MPRGGRRRRAEVQGAAFANLIEVQAAPTPDTLTTTGEAAPHSQLATNAEADRGCCFRFGLQRSGRAAPCTPPAAWRREQKG